MEGEELVNFVVLGVHDNDHQCSTSCVDRIFCRLAIEFTTLAAHAQGGTLFTGGDIIHYSLVNNVRGT